MSRLESLKNLAGKMPVANQQAAQQLQAGRLVGLQQAVSQAQSPITKQQVQQGAAQQVTQSAGIQNQVAGAAQAQALDTGGALLREQQTQQSSDIDARRLSMSQSNRAAENTLNSMEMGVKQELFDRQLDFQKKEDGRTIFNQAQLTDWAITKSQNSEQFKGKVQKMEQAHKMNLLLMETAQNKINEALQFEMNKKIQDRNQATLQKLQEAKAAAEKRYQDAVSAYKNNQSQWQMGGMIIGTVVGSYFGPAGAAAGGSLGSSAGTLAHGATSKEPEPE